MQKKAKILAITSHYPPYHVGGYEMRCKNVLDRLADRGYEIKIIVSDKLKGSPPPLADEKNVYRQFHLLNSFDNKAERLIHDYLDVKFLQQTINFFSPDLVYLWQTTNISKAIFPYLAECDPSIVYDEGDTGLINSWTHGGTWFSYIEGKSKSGTKNKIKAFAAKIVSKFSGNLIKEQWNWPENMRVYFNSDLGKRNALAHGIPVRDALVIHSGVDINQFSFQPRNRINSPIRIIVPGRVEYKKGQIDNILLLSYLREKKLEADLTIVGKSNSAVYSEEIEGLIRELGLEKHICVLPMIDHDKLIHLYQESDICFFSSYRKTGLSRVPLEAMACGCLVITYGNEGSDEIIENNRTGYIVSQKDFQSMVVIVEKMISDPLAYRQLVTNARKVVEQKYSLDAYVNKIETLLLDVVKQ
jgi:glycosyltransferase involved in cell wall biosynthesis